MFEVALMILHALSLHSFVGEVDIVAGDSKVEIFIDPPLTQEKINLIPENIKENCTVIKDDDKTVITVRL